MVVFAEKRVVMCDEKLSTSLLARNSGEQMRIMGSLNISSLNCSGSNWKLISSVF